jgi:hypothetical protein
MALLLRGGLLGGMAGEAGGVDGPEKGAGTLATPPEGSLAASETGGPAHLLHLCLFRAFARCASIAHCSVPNTARIVSVNCPGSTIIGIDMWWYFRLYLR